MVLHQIYFGIYVTHFLTILILIRLTKEQNESYSITNYVSHLRMFRYIEIYKEQINKRKKMNPIQLPIFDPHYVKDSKSPNKPKSPKTILKEIVSSI
jgi:vacuolar-type H+-ATPase subunit C/Vma6